MTYRTPPPINWNAEGMRKLLRRNGITTRAELASKLAAYGISRQTIYTVFTAATALFTAATALRVSVDEVDRLRSAGKLLAKRHGTKVLIPMTESEKLESPPWELDQ